MTERLTRIAINADATWDFRFLVRTQALELYRSSERTFFWTTTRPFAGSADLGTLLGAFPEDFSYADSGVADELASEVRDLITERKGQAASDRLSVVVILSADDFRVLADPRVVNARLWPPPGLSEAGQMAIGALAEALDTLTREETREDTIEPARSRFWAGIAVRNLGHQRPADYQAANNVQIMFQKRFGQTLGAVVFLSNGPAGNGLPDADTIQFFKLRALLDMLGQKPVLARLREAVREGSRAFWLQLKGTQQLPPSLSDSIARGVLQSFAGGLGEVGAIDPDNDAEAMAALSTLRSELDKLQPLERTAALAKIKQTVSQQPDHVDDSQGLLSVKLDHSDMTGAIEELGRNKRRGLLYSAERINRIARLAPVFHAAFRNAMKSQNAAVDTLLTNDQTLMPSRTALLRELDRYHAPRSDEGKQMLSDLKTRLARDIAEIGPVMAAIRQDRTDETERMLRSESERQGFFDGVIAAESTMLRPSALLPVMKVLGAFATVAIFWEIWRAGHIPGYDILNILQTLGTTYVWPLGVMLALAFAITLAVAVRLNRKRVRANGLLAERLGADWNWVVTASADRLVAATARRVASQRRLMRNRLAVSDDLVVTDHLAEFLEHLRSAAMRPAAPGTAPQEATVVRHFTESMARGTSKAERLRTALSSFEPPPGSDLLIEAESLQNEPVRVPSNAATGQVSLLLEQGVGRSR